MNRLKEYREKKGYTQNMLSKTSKVSRATIIEIEKGDKPDVKVSTLKALAKALDATVKEIFFY